MDTNDLWKLRTYKATTIYFLWGLWAQNDRVTKGWAFGAECSPGTSGSLLVPGACPTVLLQLSSVFSTITVDLQGLFENSALGSIWGAL